MSITRRSICTPIIAKLGYKPGLCPNAEAAYRQILTLPMFPAMTASDVRRVVAALTKATA